MKAKVGIVGYGMGNVMSLRNAFAAISADVFVAERPAELGQATHIALPGVGAFGAGMQALERGGFIDALREEVLTRRKPFLGICLGMQLLATTGLEQGCHAGLNWIAGRVERFPTNGLRVPLVGWCDVDIKGPTGLFRGLSGRPSFYFVHSYHLVPDSREVVASTCAYGIEFVAAVQAGHIIGTQFHPEKSQKAGLAVLNNFLQISV